MPAVATSNSVIGALVVMFALRVDASDVELPVVRTAVVLVGVVRACEPLNGEAPWVRRRRFAGFAWEPYRRDRTVGQASTNPEQCCRPAQQRVLCVHAWGVGHSGRFWRDLFPGAVAPGGRGVRGGRSPGARAVRCACACA